MASSRFHASGKPRDAIGSLCQLLNLNGVAVELTAETFRQAKFNKPQAVIPLLSLLATLTHYSSHGCIPSKLPHSSSSSSSVKHAMWVEEYRCSDFHRLPDNMSGSRELLLACGLLLAKTDILTSLIMAVDSKIVSDISHFHLEEIGQTVMKGEGFFSRRAEKDDHDEDEVRRADHSTERLTWLVGRCRMLMRQLYHQQQEMCNLNHQIHVATKGVSVSTDSSHLSPLETFIIRHAHHLKKYQEMLEAEHARLHLCLRWQEQQSTFWQWMESVLDAKLQDSASVPKSLDDVFVPTPTPPGDHLGLLLKELDECSQQLHHHVVQEFDSNEEDNTAAHSRSKLRITGEVNAQLVPPPSSPSSTPSRRCHRQNTRFHLINQTTKQTKLASRPTASPRDGFLDVKVENERLSEAVDGLRGDLEELRRGHRSKMDDVTSVLKDAVCIPPMGSAR